MDAIVVAVTVKPTSGDGWTIAIAAALLVALMVIFLAPLRGRSTERPVALPAD